MSAKRLAAALAILAGTAAGIAPAQAQPYTQDSSAAPLVALPANAPAPQPVDGPEAGPAIRLRPPVDPMPGITVAEARGLDIPPQPEQPGGAPAAPQ
jgi:hypothetical protein